jgi:hypothetical protein
MKPKTFEKKLSLNKKTIANLKDDELSHAVGGINEPPTEHTCMANTCPTDCGTCATHCTCAPPPYACRIT